MNAIVVSSLTSLNQNICQRTLILPKNPLFKLPTYKFLCFSSLSSPKPYLKPYTHHHETPPKSSTEQKTLLVHNTSHETHRLRELVNKLNEEDSEPLEILKDEGDWSREQFWTVIRFLKETSRFKEVLQVFDVWKNIDKSRINEVNYEKIIVILGEVGLMEEAISTLQDMKTYGITASSKIYNSIIHGFARKGEFDEALMYIKEMGKINLKPGIETYNGLIQSYGNYEMYDEMGKCVKKMESEGCFPNDVTYNILIVGFAHGGLLKRMERAYRTLLSKRMELRSSTLNTMLEAYTDLGILEDMEKVYRKLLNLRVSLNESLIRKIANVYIRNYMFSRLDDLGIDFASRYGRKDVVWCLRLLSPACLLSKKGIDKIVHEMEISRFSWNVTVMNIMVLSYLKMKDLRQLDILFSQFQTLNVKPDIVTVGALFDANEIGFKGIRVLQVWRKNGLLEETVEMKTDPLVLTAFGKGHFLRNCEEKYTSVKPDVREKSVWTYHDMIDLVIKHN